MADSDTAALSERIGEVRKRIARYRRRDALGEQNTKGALIEPVLQALGWDISDPDEVHREFKAERQDGPVDYALKTQATPQILVEAKALEDSLHNRRWVSQVVSYASVAGVQWCVLTNGDEYRIYNAHAPVGAEEKLLRAVSVSETKEHERTLETLGMLAKESIPQGALEALWEADFVDRRVGQAVCELFGRQDASLVRLIRRHTPQGLTASQIRESLQRARVDVAFAPAGERESIQRQPPALPSMQQIELPLLRAMLRRGGQVDIRTELEHILAELADHFRVSPQAQRVLTPNRKRRLWEARVRFTRNRLRKQGEIDSPRLCIWRVTERGKRRADSAQDAVAAQADSQARGAATPPGLPTDRMIQLPLLRALLRRGGMIDIRADGKALFAELGKHFGLTPEQQRTLTRSGKEPAWVNRVRWTRQRLINNGDLDGSQRGIWRLTNQGRRRGESAEDT
jgi:hypothetical protein